MAPLNEVKGVVGYPRHALRVAQGVPPTCYNAGMRRRVLLVQLPIPPLGPAPIRGNVPLAGAYLKLFAQRKGLGAFYDLDVFPAEPASSLGDQALAAAIAGRRPWLVGFTCYLWNIERTLHLAQAVKPLPP